MVMSQFHSGHSSFNPVQIHYTIKNTAMWSFLDSYIFKQGQSKVNRDKEIFGRGNTGKAECLL